MGEVPRREGELMALSDKDEARARVETARAALDDDLATLTDRLPAASVIAGAGAAGGTGLALLGMAAKQVQKKLDQRSQDKALTREAEIQARAIAAAIAAVGMGSTGPSGSGGGSRRADDDDDRREVRVPVPPRGTMDEGDEDGGAPWGILLLLAALVAAVVALVSGKDDSDLWTTPQATAPDAVKRPD